MKARFLLAGFIAALFAFEAIGEEATEVRSRAAVVPPKKAPEISEVVRDVPDIVFLSSARPIRIRLNFTVGDKPLEAAWRSYINKLFTYFDVDGDGVLSKQEVEKAPRAQTLQYLTQGVIGLGPNGNTIRMEEIDTAPKDGKVSRDEFAAYYRRADFGPFRLALGPDRKTSDKLTEVLFEHLDLNKDGKLSRDEMTEAPASLHRLDLDEDEVIGVDELVSGTGNQRRFARQAIQGNAEAEMRKAGMFLVIPGKLASNAAAQIFAHYDKNKRHNLSREEIGLDVDTFAKLDTNKDGKLNVREFAKWLAGPADLEFRVQFGPAPKVAARNVFAAIAQELGQAAASKPTFEVVPGNKNSALARALHKRNGNDTQLTLVDAELVFSRRPNANYSGTEQFYIQQFKLALGGKKYLDKKQAMQSPYFQGLFDLADRNGDGKLYEEELGAWLDLQAQAGSSFVMLAATDYGQGLFELLDTNNDGRLSLREMRAGWSRLATLDRPNRGYVAREEIPRKFEFLAFQGNQYFMDRFSMPQPAATGGFAGIFGQGRGPRWFQKMDRNGDGDVSLNEFLGSPADFKRIDIDGDGLIDAKEAAQADAWFKNQSKK